MVKLYVEVEGAQEFQRILGKLTGIVQDLTPVWQVVIEKFFDIEEETFDSEGYGSWPPLSERYAEWKYNHFGSLPLLVLTGEMRHQFTSPSGAAITRGPQSLRINFTSPSYAKFHQTGTSRMPARPPVILGPQQREALSDAAVEEIRKQIKRVT